jgi:Flp pilus assembly protein TadD
MKLLDEKKFDQALAAANEALRMRDDQAQFHRLKGDALLGLGLIAEAKAAYNESLERDGRYVLANIGLGRAYLAEGNAAAAEREFEKAARGFPGGVVGQYGLGIARFNQGKHAEALDPLRRTAAAVPQDPNVRYALATCYDELGQPALAYQAYGEALEAGLTGTPGLKAQRRLDALQPAVAPPQGGGS